MRAVWKYTLINNDQALTVPNGACVVHLESGGGGVVHIWFDLDPGALPCPRHFVILGTGRDVPENAKYIGTVIEPNPLASYVWHIFEVPYD